MSIDTAIHVHGPSRSSAYLDWLQMLTGAGLILFMWAHMILVASVIIGPGVMDAIAHFFEATYMAQVGGPIIGLIFLLHFMLAARKIPFQADQQSIIWKHSRMLAHRDTWLWLVQVVTAMIILIMGAIHMWVVLTDLPITAAKSAARIQGGFWMGFYLILLPLVELHVGIGLYRIAVKWGFIRRDKRSGMQRFELVVTSAFIFIGLMALLRFYFLAI
ncbi:succinate dehydrogenase subunit C [Desulfonatronum thiosulfatophilum]|uniref:Succinate dehydrogenase subunit C n=1 Tax=Desulfonatronum thiosulfatophilum TaxID=617002 RepID=A0A1G6D3D7_9BACT|nr:succinate dehydrogenase/fumarate reductase cytochrome b subunit [Desulfonatronum thiosulfatophilum]SDB39600.1 succinate dehydrogenase subunit C [Desulfonatronum thiosulfatophilum]